MEERFLTERQGDVYQQYCRRVPRLLPRLAAGDITSSGSPRWVSAFLNETYPIAITLCFALFAWRYNARILIRCVLICYGLSLVVRAMTKRPAADAARSEALVADALIRPTLGPRETKIGASAPIYLSSTDLLCQPRNLVRGAGFQTRGNVRYINFGALALVAPIRLLTQT